MDASPERRAWGPSEMRARRLAGAPDIPPVIRTFLTDQLRAFFPRLPLVFVAGLDARGRPTASLLRGAPGFIAAPEPSRLEIAAAFPDGESIVLGEGAPFGLIGIDFAARRRNRVNGRIAGVTPGGLTLLVEEAFGNCPKYIAPRETPAATHPGAWRDVPALDAEARETIASSVAVLVASSGSGGVDISHRGGPSGFVEIEPEGALRIPDYPGNNYFNTLGNLLENPEAALMFPDFVTGRVLRISGRAHVDFAKRFWTFRPSAAQLLISAPLLESCLGVEAIP